MESYLDQASNTAVQMSPKNRDVTVGRGENFSVSSAVAVIDISPHLKARLSFPTGSIVDFFVAAQADNIRDKKKNLRNFFISNEVLQKFKTGDESFSPV